MSPRGPLLLTSLPVFLADFYINYCPFCSPLLPLRTLIFLHIYIPLDSPVTSSPPLSVHHRSTSSPFSQDAPALFTCLLLAIFSYARSVTTLPRFGNLIAQTAAKTGAICQMKTQADRVGTQLQITHHTHSYLPQQRNRWN